MIMKRNNVSVLKTCNILLVVFLCLVSVSINSLFSSYETLTPTDNVNDNIIIQKWVADSTWARDTSWIK